MQERHTRHCMTRDGSQDGTLVGTWNTNLLQNVAHRDCAARGGARAASTTIPEFGAARPSPFVWISSS